MKKIFSSALFVALTACAGKPAQVAPAADAHVWRYAVRTDAQGVRKAFAVDMNSTEEVALPDGLWCPHGALIELERDGAGKVVGAVSRAEEVTITSEENNAFHHWSAKVFDPLTCDTEELEGSWNSLTLLPVFALAPTVEELRNPLIVLRWKLDEHQVNWAILERRPNGLRMTELGPWQIEHIQFQRMERPGPGLENCVLLTFQAGEGSQHAVVKVEVGEKGAKLRPLTEGDAQVLRHFLARATDAEKVVVGRVLGE